MRASSAGGRKQPPLGAAEEALRAEDEDEGDEERREDLRERRVKAREDRQETETMPSPTQADQERRDQRAAPLPRPPMMTTMKEGSSGSRPIR